MHQLWEENLRGLPTKDVSSTPVGMGPRCDERRHNVHSDRVIHMLLRSFLFEFLFIQIPSVSVQWDMVFSGVMISRHMQIVGRKAA